MPACLALALTACCTTRRLALRAAQFLITLSILQENILATR